MSAADSLRTRTIGFLWPAKARLDYFRLRLNPPRYALQGKTYPIHVGWYNKTWRNERQVEIPPALELVAATPPEEVLEVGNVLAHYGSTGHTVVDKYELAPGSLAVDVVDYEPLRRFQLVVAISTLEHVGWDEPERDPAKFRRAVRHLASLLTPGGLLWASVPLGHNPAADAFVAKPDPGFEISFLVRGSKRPGDWREAAGVDPGAHPYDPAVPTAGAVAILRHRAPSG
jgi:SAM-dependent methyltransferase